MKAWLLKFHRWIALAFALPLAIVLITGLILSFEPWLVIRAIQPGSLTAGTIQALLAQHDPSGKARAISFRSYDGTLTISAGRGENLIVDVATGNLMEAPTTLANVLSTSRRLHEALLIDASWLVIASTGAMLLLCILGVSMGLPKFRNTVGGWHKGVAWLLLPLVVLSPLTALFMAGGITFSGQPGGGQGGKPAAIALAESVGIVAQRHDLSALVWLRQRGGRMLARVVEDGEYRVYEVTRDGTKAAPRNWPRLWHEGNFAGGWSALMNVITSIALLGLLGTGGWIWLRRQLMRRRVRQGAELASSSTTTR